MCGGETDLTASVVRTMSVMSSAAPSTVATMTTTSFQSENSEIRERRTECNRHSSAQIKHKHFDTLNSYTLCDCFSPQMGGILTLSAVEPGKTEWTADGREDPRVRWFSGLVTQQMMLQIEKGYLWHLLHAFVVDCLLATLTSCKNRQRNLCYTHTHTHSDV